MTEAVSAAQLSDNKDHAADAHKNFAYEAPITAELN